MNIKQILEHNAGKVLDYIRKWEPFQIYIDSRFSRAGSSVIYDEFIKNLYYPYKGFEFLVTDQTLSIFEDFEHYNSSDILPSDIVLDIGANVGGFSFLASKKAKHVYAVEPIYSDIILNNLNRNNITNVTILKIGLGKGVQKISYGKINKTVKCFPLSEIISSCTHPPTFLKLDCEGAEWSIKPEELKNIRRIEVEVHNIDGFHDVNNFVKMLEKAGFKCKVRKFFDHLIIVHAYQQKTSRRNISPIRHIKPSVQSKLHDIYYQNNR